MSNLGNKLNKLIERKKGSEVNPWAVCHASTGPETDDKFERCVNKVKSKHKIKEAIKSKLNLMEAPEGEETPAETKPGNKGLNRPPLKDVSPQSRQLMIRQRALGMAVRGAGDRLKGLRGQQPPQQGS